MPNPGQSNKYHMSAFIFRYFTCQMESTISLGKNPKRFGVIYTVIHHQALPRYFPTPWHPRVALPPDRRGWGPKITGEIKLDICNYSNYTLHATNSLHLKMDGWKMSFLLGPGLFSVTKSYFQGVEKIGDEPITLIYLVWQLSDSNYRFGSITVVSCNWCYTPGRLAADPKNDGLKRNFLSTMEILVPMFAF